MIRDTSQKVKVIRYCVAMELIPYMEVLVRYVADTADDITDITDIDVLGIQPAGQSAARRIIFDCKSTAKMSSINRALWAAGLREMLHADEAFVILGKSAPHGHRLASNEVNVRLYSEVMFDRFAASASKEYSVPSSYLERIEPWEAIAEVRAHYPNLRDFVEFLSSQAPLERNGANGLRHLVGQLKRFEGELDPTKAGHRALFALLVSQALVYLSDMVSTYHSIFDPELPPAELEKSLRHFVWGGRESYELRNRLNHAVKSAKGNGDTASLELPAWMSFLEIFRSFLDAPFSLAATCLPIKDLAFRELSQPDQALDARLARRLNGNNRVRQFAFLTGRYLTLCSKLPRAFYEHFNSTINVLANADSGDSPETKQP